MCKKIKVGSKDFAKEREIMKIQKKTVRRENKQKWKEFEEFHIPACKIFVKNSGRK